jgi:hypothetical protein
MHDTPKRRRYNRAKRSIPQTPLKERDTPRTESIMNEHNQNTTPVMELPPQPAEDGIRWELVQRIRKLIAEGKYDTPERWAAAEELLFGSLEQR